MHDFTLAWSKGLDFRFAVRLASHKPEPPDNYAEDVLQEIWLRAWRQLDTFQYHLSFCAWLYKLVTHACLDLLEQCPRHTLPTALYPVADPTRPIAVPVQERIWLEPLPDKWLAKEAVNPEARSLLRESVTLASLVVLHRLPRASKRC